MISKNSITTKRGDLGFTSTISQRKISKSSLLIETIGTIDELDSFLGFIKAKLNKKISLNKNKKQFVKKINYIQRLLHKISANLSGSNKFNDFTEDLNVVEKMINNYSIEFKRFVLYGENEIESILNITRAITRRTERNLVKLSKNKKINKDIMKILNRLSDLLYLFSQHF